MPQGQQPTPMSPIAPPPPNIPLLPRICKPILANRLQAFSFIILTVYKYIIMNKAEQAHFMPDHAQIPAFDDAMGDTSLQCWSSTGSGFQLKLYVSEYILTTKQILCRNNDVQFFGTFSHLNGSPLMVPVAYKQMFVQICNQNCHTVTFFMEEDRNQVELVCKLAFKSQMSISDKITMCSQEIQKSMKGFQRALQTIGVNNKFNRYSLQVKKLELELKKHSAEALTANSSPEAIPPLAEKAQQNKSVVKVSQVVDHSSESQENVRIKKGGYFKVERKQSAICEMSGEMKEKDLAWKTPINVNSLSTTAEEKIRKEVQLVGKIVDTKYTLTYYFQESKPSSIYMDYVPGLLKDSIYKKELSVQKMVHLAQQMIEAVEILHASKIVHRDLKPENILIDESNNLKLIDFAQSASMDDPFIQNQNSLGYTLPYSPIECNLGKEEGFNKKEIDLWSISVILYEMAFKSIPLYYTRWIGHEILSKWRTTGEFSIFPIYRRRRGAMGIETIASLAGISGIQINPQQRLGLKSQKAILQGMRLFGESLSKLF